MTYLRRNLKILALFIFIIIIIPNLSFSEITSFRVITNETDYPYEPYENYYNSSLSFNRTELININISYNDDCGGLRTTYFNFTYPLLSSVVNTTTPKCYISDVGGLKVINAAIKDNKIYCIYYYEELTPIHSINLSFSAYSTNYNYNLYERWSFIGGSLTHL